MDRGVYWQNAGLRLFQSILMTICLGWNWFAQNSIFFLDQVNKLTDVRSKDLSHTFNHLPRLLKIYLINPFSYLPQLSLPTHQSLFPLSALLHSVTVWVFVNMWWLLSCVVLHWWYLIFRNSTYDNRKTLTMQLWTDWDSTFYRVYTEF